MKKKMTLDARSLRIILIVMLLLFVGLGVVGFYLLQKTLSDYANETSALNSQVSVSDQNVQSLQKVKDYLATHKPDVERARQIVADSQQYQYQNEIVDDLTSFARSTGVQISGFNFTAGTTGPDTSKSSPTTSTAPPSTVKGANLHSTTVNVSIASPVDYNKLLAFISRIEQNLTKMQITSVSLTGNNDPDSKNTVSSEAFNIEVYVR